MHSLLLEAERSILRVGGTSNELTTCSSPVQIQGITSPLPHSQGAADRHTDDSLECSSGALSGKQNSICVAFAAQARILTSCKDGAAGGAAAAAENDIIAAADAAAAGAADLEVGQDIGMGVYGRVVRGMYMGRLVAVKLLHARMWGLDGGNDVTRHAVSS